MLIDARWVGRWVAFMLGQARPPGPISNRRLFLETTIVLETTAAEARREPMTRPRTFAESKHPPPARLFVEYGLKFRLLRCTWYGVYHTL